MNNKPIHNPDFLEQTRADRPTRSLQLFQSASFLCGIFENEIATVSIWRDPTPLPHSPPTILGVVSIQGRMLTVLNLAMLLDNAISSNDPLPANILALRGDEQLALPVDSLAETIVIEDSVLDGAQKHRDGIILGVINQNGIEVTVLNVKELFPSAVQGRERRRRRF
ncbi:MAG TPA: chemotaxis protein CheW [Pyrinomonadaceae bacterium]|nr:chemotaxis protein CheW [Pyrinomonadaceae bacterium]